MRRFHYFNECLTGVFGVSDYCFSCVVEAESEEQAFEWGQRVAKEYNDRFGLLPRGRKLGDEELIENGGVTEWDVADDEHLHKHLFCRVGELPDLVAWENSRPKFPWS
ncbi:MAG: hypothetical protein QM775_03975 [Pirellulales bacterium]